MTTAAPAALTIRFGEHLFINGDNNNINGQHCGQVLFPEADKAEWLRLLRARHEHFANRGIPFSFILAPDKQSVYRHILPPEYRFRPAAFLTDLPFVLDPAPVLAALAPLVDVYPRTDSHWNQLGSYLAVQAWAARNGINMPEIIGGWTENTNTGDLGHKLAQVEVSPVLKARVKSNAALIYDNLVPNNGRIRIWAKPAAECPAQPSRLVLFGDSFSYDLVHFLCALFDVVVHVHGFALDYRITDHFQPDLVIAEITERFVQRVPNPIDGEPLNRLWEDKIRTRTRLERAHGVTAPEPGSFPDAALSIAAYADELFAPFRARLSV